MDVGWKQLLVLHLKVRLRKLPLSARSINKLNQKACKLNVCGLFRSCNLSKHIRSSTIDSANLVRGGNGENQALYQYK